MKIEEIHDISNTYFQIEFAVNSLRSRIESDAKICITMTDRLFCEFVQCNEIIVNFHEETIEYTFLGTKVIRSIEPGRKFSVGILYDAEDPVIKRIETQ